MPITVHCTCRHRWEGDDSLAGKRLLCPACDEGVAVSANTPFRVRCPSSQCGKAIALHVPESAHPARCRCPSCGARFKVGRPAAVKTATTENEVGSYAVAAESSIGYLLAREADGFRLTAEEKAAKHRLITQRLASCPDRCPGCEES